MSDLPKISSSHTQSEDAEKALESAFRRPHFITRKIEPDYGADYAIELGYAGRATNLHFHVQLKSLEAGEPIAGGEFLTVTLKVTALEYIAQAAHINHLLVFDESTQLLHYVRLLEVVVELDERNAGWREQRTVTVRVPVANQLTPAAAQEIHGRVLGWWQAHIALQELFLTLASPTTSTPVPAEFADPSAFLDLLVERGLELVSEGHHREILERLGAVSTADWIDRYEVVLAAAFANLSAGYPLPALHLANQIPDDVATNGLTDGQQAMLQTVRAMAKVDLGTIDSAEYQSTVRGIAAAFPRTAVGAQAQMQALFADLVDHLPRQGQDLEFLQDVLARAQRCAGEVDDSFGEDSDIAAAVRVHHGRIELEVADRFALHAIGRRALAANMGHPLTDGELQDLLEEPTRLHRSGMDRLAAVRDGLQRGNRVMLAALSQLELDDARFKSHLTLDTARRLHGDSRSKDGDVEFLNEMSTSVAAARDVLGEAGHRQLAFRAGRLLADIANLLGNVTERDRLMSELEEEKRVCGLGATLSLRSDLTPPTRNPETLSDESWVSMTEEDIDVLCRRVVGGFRISEDRLETVVATCHARIGAARRRLDWCRHLQLREDLRHTQSRETAYAEPPEYGAICELLGHTSAFPHTDAAAVLKSFEVAHCKECDRREPKSGGVI